MGIVFGWFAVGALTLIAFVGVVVWAGAEEDRWDERRLDVVAENIGARNPVPSPDEPLVVKHRQPVAIGAALAVAVIGSVVVLLATIAARMPARHT